MAKKWKKLYQQKWFAYIEIAVLLCLAAIFLYQLYHNDPGGGWFRCPVNALTGLECIGCGYTHALRSLLHLQLLQAHRENLMVIPLTLMLVFLGLRYLRFRLFGGKKVFDMKPAPFVVLLAAGLLYMLARNLL